MVQGQPLLKQQLLAALSRLEDRATQPTTWVELCALARDAHADDLPTFIDVLTKTNMHHSQLARREAVRLLGVLGGAHACALSAHTPRVVGALLARVRDKESGKEVREAVVHTFGELVGLLLPHLGTVAPFFSPLLLALGEQVEASQTTAAACLSAALRAAGPLGDDIAARLHGALLRLLHHGTLGAQPQLLAATGAFLAASGGSARPYAPSLALPLVAACAASEFATRKAAAEQIGVALAAHAKSLGAQQARMLGALVALKADKSNVVRSAAVRALEEAQRALDAGPGAGRAQTAPGGVHGRAGNGGAGSGADGEGGPGSAAELLRLQIRRDRRASARAGRNGAEGGWSWQIAAKDPPAELRSRSELAGGYSVSGGGGRGGDVELRSRSEQDPATGGGGAGAARRQANGARGPALVSRAGTGQSGWMPESGWAPGQPGWAQSGAGRYQRESGGLDAEPSLYAESVASSANSESLPDSDANARWRQRPADTGPRRLGAADSGPRTLGGADSGRYGSSEQSETDSDLEFEQGGPSKLPDALGVSVVGELPSRAEITAGASRRAQGRYAAQLQQGLGQAQAQAQGQQAPPLWQQQLQQQAQLAAEPQQQQPNYSSLQQPPPQPQQLSERDSTGRRARGVWVRDRDSALSLLGLHPDSNHPPGLPDSQSRTTGLPDSRSHPGLTDSLGRKVPDSSRTDRAGSEGTRGAGSERTRGAAPRRLSGVRTGGAATPGFGQMQVRA
ncbi:armadillo-type protein [Pavlovales sp. CCMP2436]|nr:armadillo-type protein [Pavlovales sp. CCMP2436]